MATRTAHARLLDTLTGFLVDRLTEELEALWAREPDVFEHRDLLRLTAQAAILEEYLAVLRDGGLPTPSQLGVLLIAYRAHPDYDPDWPEAFVKPPPRGRTVEA
jgi:hypothetical protein